MGIIDELSNKELWFECLNHKLEKGHITKRDEKYWRDFIENEQYISLVQKLQNGDYCYEYPEKKYVNKTDTNKKRVVYSFAEDESMVLKLISYLLSRYDSRLSSNVYSFRKNRSPKEAVRQMTVGGRTDNLYCYKVDVSNYFNSINCDKLLVILKDVLADDIKMYEFIENLLTQDKSYCEGELIEEKRGAMAGTAISPFLANIYLTEMDKFFETNNILYARYSDDIICFAKDEDKLNNYKETILNYLDKYDLTVNCEKESNSKPHEKWEFLGISYQDGVVELSDATIMKMKGKIRRKARALYRWKVKKHASDEQAVKVMIKVFNRKFYAGDDNESTDLTWSRWFFPLINSDIGLKEIDSYLQQYIRYIATGRHSKKNYELTYSMIKEMGYRSLVNEFYSHKIPDNKVYVKR